VYAAVSSVARDCRFDVRRDAFLYSLLRSCLAWEPMRTRSPTFLMPMSFRCVWSISIRFSPLMWLSLNSSTYWPQLMRFSQSPTLSSSQCLCLLASRTVFYRRTATHRMASGASYISENSDSVGEANMDWSARVLAAWLR
jgi:hypothetical protein